MNCGVGRGYFFPRNIRGLIPPQLPHMPKFASSFLVRPPFAAFARQIDYSQRCYVYCRPSVIRIANTSVSSLPLSFSPLSFSYQNLRFPTILEKHHVLTIRTSIYWYMNCYESRITPTLFWKLSDFCLVAIGTHAHRKYKDNSDKNSKSFAQCL